MCNLHYQRARYGRPLDQPTKIEYATCTVEDCSNKPRSRYATLCPMHYHRQYRHQDTQAQANTAGISASHGRKYLMRYAPTHPLAKKNGKVYAHRLVLFNAIGWGPHACHWCGTRVEWVAKGEQYELQPDHLNNIGNDNRLENLVPSCRACNTARGTQRRHDALTHAGYWSGNDTVANLAKGRSKRVEQRRAS
jgi:hypothetical protein